MVSCVSKSSAACVLLCVLAVVILGCLPANTQPITDSALPRPPSDGADDGGNDGGDDGGTDGCTPSCEGRECGDDGCGGSCGECEDGVPCDPERGVCVPNCGNEAIDAGETCDPPESCPADCDDGNACTADVLVGSAEACTARCEHTPVEECVDGDGCCAAGCNSATDGDCSQSCGDGILDPGETCDPPESCDIDCDDGNACTEDVLTGSADTCSAACANSPVTACNHGDGCCPAGCGNETDSDCSASCGDGVLDPGETCDPPDTCDTDCDDGNACTNDVLTGSAETCSAACSHSSIVSCNDGDGCCPAGCNSGTDDDCSPSCGNGVLDPGETCDPPESCDTDCDDGNACTNDLLTGSAAACNAACSHSEVVSCGHGDGCCPPGCDNTTDDDCSVSCGNGVVEDGETCDPPDSCDTDCDDDNACTDDLLTGSAATCNAACSHSNIVTCDHGDGCCPPGCDNTTDDDCSVSCGNGVVEDGETCDPPESCDTDCDDDNACTDDLLTGSAAACNAACSHSNVVSCEDGDGCCPTGCDGGSDDDCGGSPDCRDAGTWPPDWVAFEDEVAVIVNEERAAGATCGGTYYPPQPPVVMNAELREAARCHSVDMAINDFFDHTGSNGSSPWDRIDEAGYDAFATGENIAAGYTSPAAVMEGWMDSPGHCANIMSGESNEIGVGYFYYSASTYRHYWTQDFGYR